MAETRVWLHTADVTLAALQCHVDPAIAAFDLHEEGSSWAQHLRIRARSTDGRELALRVKRCAGSTFGASEVEYYTRDYVDLPDAPLVRCFHAAFQPGVGYHLLLQDLGDSHADRRGQAPTLAHGVSLARALARLHRHHWQCQAAPPPAVFERYLDHVRGGLQAIRRDTGLAALDRFDAHADALRARWADPAGMTLLHGDLNPTNVLTPHGADGPPLFLDRQPFDWSLTYGLAVHDLAYATVPWWSEQEARALGPAVLRAWHDALDVDDYPWARAQHDWALSVEQCLHVPIEWCREPADVERMRWLWSAQLQRVAAAVRAWPWSPGKP